MSSEILGHDCDGKPLRAGDRVVRITDGPLSGGRAGDVHTIVGPCPVNAECVEIDLPHKSFLWKWWSVFADQLRKIDQPELGNWSEIHKQTGWKPGKEERRETEKTT